MNSASVAYWHRFYMQAKRKLEEGGRNVCGASGQKFSFSCVACINCNHFMMPLLHHNKLLAFQLSEAKVAASCTDTVPVADNNGFFRSKTVNAAMHNVIRLFYIIIKFVAVCRSVFVVELKILRYETFFGINTFMLVTKVHLFGILFHSS